MNRKTRWLVVILFIGILGLAGCKKRVAPPLPPPPPPPAPTASLSANPSSMQKGQSTQLTWRTENATDVSIEGIGKVEANGSQAVTPAESTTYRLVAKGPGGQEEATARVTVTQPPPPQPAVTATDEELFARNVKDAFFDYDSFQIRPDAQQQLAADAQFLNQKPGLRFTLAGHCDERGSTEYNLALGDSRANAARQALAQLGVSADRIHTRSYGKEKPFCTESSESCWQQNRRAHFVLER